MQMTSVSPTISLIKLVKQQITMLARSIVREGSCLVGTSGFLLIAIRRSEGMFAALDDWILSGEAQDPKACQRDGSGLTVIRSAPPEQEVPALPSKDSQSLLRRMEPEHRCYRRVSHRAGLTCVANKLNENDPSPQTVLRTFASLTNQTAGTSNKRKSTSREIPQ